MGANNGRIDKVQVPIDVPARIGRRYPVNAALLLLIAMVVLRVILGATMPADASIFFAPTLACLFVFAAFFLMPAN